MYKPNYYSHAQSPLLTRPNLNAYDKGKFT